MNVLMRKITMSQSLILLGCVLAALLMVGCGGDNTTTTTTTTTTPPPVTMTNVVGNVWVDGTLYSVHFEDGVTAENLNESDVTPYIESIVDVEGNELDPASEDVAGLINHTSQDIGAASGRVCFDSAGSAINCDAIGAPA